MKQLFPTAGLQPLRHDSGVALMRRPGGAGVDATSLVLIPLATDQISGAAERLQREFALRERLDPSWALMPRALTRTDGAPVLELDDPGGRCLAELVGAPLETGQFLALAIGIAEALGRVHRAGLIHKDVKPANIMVNCRDGRARLTGFAMALPVEGQTDAPPEMIAGTLAFMAPEQSGRTNRAVDVRSDLYALGVTLYLMATGTMPFEASDPMELIHSHMARRPDSPCERERGVQPAVSAIIMKLLEKAPEDRYQTAAGLLHDLRQCLDAWMAEQSIPEFPAGARDVPGRLSIPDKLYGRERESAAIRDCLSRVARSGAAELVLVSGHAGVGKSALVEGLHKTLASGALFASGKFDQHQRDVPYATLVQALQGLVRYVLARSDAELRQWRLAIRDALGAHGRLMTELVPELELVIGEQPPVPELSLQQAQVRFQATLQRLIGAFARRGQPLVLFLDDLQWVDQATLDLVGELLTQANLADLLLIGAYRDNEAVPGHPLLRKRDAIRAKGGTVTDIALAPLSHTELTQMVSDTLRCSEADIAPLAALVREKTDGNPFFVRQFLSLLVDEGVLAFDHDRGAWAWDIDHIRAQRFTDNVVDLMIGKLARLPAETLRTLQTLACLGNAAATRTLALVLEVGDEEVDAALAAACALDLVEAVAGGYRFSHDRVQEAAYASIPPEARAAAHLRIGRRLAAGAPAAGHDEIVFDIANQLNRAVELITSPTERESLAAHNLAAGRRAQASAAYALAFNAFAAGAALLTDETWRSRGELAFALTFHLAECEFVVGRPVEAERRLSVLQERTTTPAQGAAVTRLRGEILVTLGQNEQAIEISLAFLRRIGAGWPAYPTEKEVQAEFAKLRRNLLVKPIEDWGDLPSMTDPIALAAMEVLLQLAPTSALATDGKLLSASVFRMANITFAHGSSEGTCVAFVWLGIVLGAHIGDYQSGYRFAKVGLDLVETRGLERFRVRTNMLFGAHVNPWARHFSAGRPLLARAYSEANEIGDVTFASYSCSNLVTLLLATGEELGTAEEETLAHLRFVRDHQFSFVADLITPQLQLMRMLQGKLPTFGRLDGDDFTEEAFEARVGHHPITECSYWIRKLQARFLTGDYRAAAEAASKAQALLWTSVYMIQIAEYHFYGAIARAAFYEEAGSAERAALRRLIGEHHDQLCHWAESAPANFEDRAALVGAEIARIEGRLLEAMELYERAIRSATEHGFVHQRAIANELTGRFYSGRGFETIARAYLREARDCYQRWGATQKAAQLNRLVPPVTESRPAPEPTNTVTSPVDSLDFATVIRISQQISGEMGTERLLDTLMRTAMEHAGADRTVLLIMEGETPRVEAEALIEPGGVVVRSAHHVTLAPAMPESVLHYVARSRESINLYDALEPSLFSDDPFFSARRVRSLLCLPLINQTKLIGLLYLENSLAPGVFTNERVAVLRLIALRAAISLENARLYNDIKERESRIRRLVESDVIGIVIWEQSGRLIDANDAFLNMLQYNRAELEAGLNWFEMTPPGSKESYLRVEAEELKATGMVRAREKEVYRKDGTPVPVLIGGAAFEANPDQGVAYILDLTELKRAEAEARENERRYQAVQSELAHANRTSTMGQLTASIAHEVNQPITALLINAQSALRALQAGKPDLAYVADALDSIVRDGNRAGEIIARIRSLIKKAPTSMERLVISEPIAEIVELVRGEAKRHSVSVRLDLEEDLPSVRGDRVQLQQVLLNLAMNAIEAMDEDCEKRELCVAASRGEDGGVVVAVKDTGPGLDAQLRENVFDAFYTTKATGLGMGLSICRSIVEAHGGRIWAGANKPKGARFVFTLPPPED